MTQLVFATHNANKAKEIAALLPKEFEVLTLSDIGFHEDIPETADTLEGNSLIKANTVKQKTGYDCFADDTGLEVAALNNAPGVHSARYAGEQRSDEDNIRKLLLQLQGKDDRSARFRTVITLILNGETHIFEGIVNGKIHESVSGTNGFGYDPVFEPENTGKTFAQMSMDEKNEMSHRARAFQNMVEFLEQ